MGRAPRKIEYIKKERTRNSTFIKRKKGLVKKCWEFSTLCGIDVCMIIYGPNIEEKSANQFYMWPDDSADVNRIINRFQEISLDERGRRAQELCDYFADRHKKANHEISKQRKKNIETKYAVSDDFIKGLSEEGLLEFTTELDSKISMIMLKLGNHHATLQQQQGGMTEPSYDAFDVQNFNPCQDLFPMSNMELGMFNHEENISPYENFDMPIPMSYYPSPSGQSSQLMLPSDQNNQMEMIVMPKKEDNFAHFSEGSRPNKEDNNNTMQYNSIQNPVQCDLTCTMQYNSVKSSVRCDPTSSYIDTVHFKSQMIASNGHRDPVLQKIPPPNGLCAEEIERFLRINSVT